MASEFRCPHSFFSSEGAAPSNPSEVSRSWEKWLEQFQYYMIATEKSEKSGAVQVATLLTALGPRGQDVFRGFGLSDARQKDFEVVKDAFSTHFRPRVREEFERFQFYSRVQKAREPFDSFLTTIRDLQATCDFDGDGVQKALHDQIVMGIHSDVTRKELLNTDDPLTLDMAIRICRRSEATLQYAREMKAASPQEELAADTVKTASQNPRRRREPDAKSDKTRSGGMVRDCKFCGGQHSFGSCPAFSKYCPNCGRKGHFASKCFRKGNAAHHVTVDSDNVDVAVDVAAAEADAIHVPTAEDECAFQVGSSARKAWWVTVKCEGESLGVKVDTGASVNVMPLCVYQNVCSQELKKCASVLTSFSGHRLKVVGKAVLDVEFDSWFHPM